MVAAAGSTVDGTVEAFGAVVDVGSDFASALSQALRSFSDCTLLMNKELAFSVTPGKSNSQRESGLPLLALNAVASTFRPFSNSTSANCGW